jgi:hypothetical protein
MKTILAVAVGNSTDQVFDKPHPDLSTVRPYVKGLISWLANQTDPPTPDNGLPKYTIGTDYKIYYRERAVNHVPDAFKDVLTLPADLIFCMSTWVAEAADVFMKANAPSKPIVAIVSDPFSEKFGDNVCGVSASRDRLAISCYKQFKKLNPNVKNVFALHRDGYLPSVRAKGWLGKKIIPVAVADGEDIKTKIDSIPNVPQRGLLILPADRFFGAANDIVQWTGSMPTFWSTPDFPKGSFGGYGYEQELCGKFLAERVASIWKNQSDGASDPIPDPKWVVIGPEYVTWRPKTVLKKKAQKKKIAKKKSAKSKKSK